jgi:ATP-dependent DNA helicase RecG
MQRESEQLALNFDPVASPPLISVGEIYTAASDSLLPQIKEDRRIERKPATYQPKALGDYFSMWANTMPEGGVIVVGIENDGAISGCSKVGTTHINKLERVGDVYCPDARYESKRIRVSTSKGTEDFLLIIRVYYNSKKVVKTVSGKAFTRHGESKTELKNYEIKELEIDKGQVELEQEPTDFLYPQDFDTDLVRQYANNYRLIFPI